jgi:hypothetical protein
MISSMLYNTGWQGFVVFHFSLFEKYMLGIRIERRSTSNYFILKIEIFISFISYKRNR